MVALSLYISIVYQPTKRLRPDPLAKEMGSVATFKNLTICPSRENSADPAR